MRMKEQFELMWDEDYVDPSEYMPIEDIDISEGMSKEWLYDLEPIRFY
jgi:hypothetical protein